MTFRYGETAAVIPSDTKPIRKEPMTMTEFDVLYQAIREELIRAGLPLFRDDMIACAEKATREAEYKALAGDAAPGVGEAGG
jgi:hypothetical protein